MGFWGTDGESGSPGTEIGDQYLTNMVINFANPVTDLSFALNSIDAVLSDGFNSIDNVKVRPFLNGAAQSNPSIRWKVWQLPVVDGDVDGVWPDVTGEGIAAVSSDGSVQLRFPETVDQVDITFTTTADHPNPGLFADGIQNWSFSVSDLSFLTGDQTAITWDPRRLELNRGDVFNNDSETFKWRQKMVR